MITLRQRIFIISSVIILIILVVATLLLLSYRNKKTGPNVEGNINTTEINPPPIGQQPTVIPDGVKPKVLTTEETEKNATKQIAKIFMERYGSYSTDNSFQNIREVQMLVSQNLWSKLSAMIKNNQNNQPFIGVTSKAVMSDIKEWGEDTAKISVGVTKEEKRDSKITTFFETYTVGMVKENGSWLVDSFTKEQ